MRYAVTSLVVLGLALLVGCGGSAPGGPAAAGKPAASAPAGGGAPAGASPAGETAVPSAVATLRAAAATEGVLNVYVPSTFAKEGLEQMQAAFNRHHGLNVEFKPTLAGSMTRDAARVVTEVTAGQTPAWDMMLVTD